MDSFFSESVTSIICRTALREYDQAKLNIGRITFHCTPILDPTAILAPFPHTPIPPTHNICLMLARIGLLLGGVNRIDIGGLNRINVEVELDRIGIG